MKQEIAPIEARLRVEATEVLRECERIAYADITDFVSWDQRGEVTVLHGSSGFSAARRPASVIFHTLPVSASIQPSVTKCLRARRIMTCHRSWPRAIRSRSPGFPVSPSNRSTFVSRSARLASPSASDRAFRMGW